MSHSSARLLYWSPRVLGIAYALFLGVFALDVFDETYSTWHIAVAFALHLIPVALIAAVLALAWNREWLGAALLPLIAAWYAWTVLPRHLDWAITMGTPLLVIAGLFLVNWIERAKLQKEQGPPGPSPVRQ